MTFITAWARRRRKRTRVYRTRRVFAGKRKKKRKKKGAEERKDNRKETKKQKKKRNVRIANFVKLGPKTVPQSSTYDRRDAFFFTRLSIIERMSILRNAVGLKNAAVDGWKNANSREEKKKKEEEGRRERKGKWKKRKGKNSRQTVAKSGSESFPVYKLETPPPPPLILSGIRSGNEPGNQKEKMAERKIK